MALYKYKHFVSTSDDQAFDSTNGPGALTPFSGIYRCEGCGKEIAANAGNPLPPQNHHQHPGSLNTIRWRLAVFAQ